MTTRAPLTPEEVAHTTANLKLARKFIQELLEHPERQPTVPEDYDAIVLLPGDEAPDPELSRANMMMADQLSRQGRRIMFWPLDMPALPGPNLVPRWSKALGEGAAMTYDARRDIMTVVFSQSERPTIPMRMNPSTNILMDSETHVVTSMTIVKFLEVAVQKAPTLGLFLLRPTTTVIGMTEHERGEVVMRVIETVLTSTGATVEWQQLLEELSA